MHTTSGFAWMNTLRFRVLALLSIALLPIGMIAVLQTNNLARASQDLSKAALDAYTQSAATEERQYFERGKSVAKYIAASAPSLLRNLNACRTRLTAFVNAETDYSHVGIVDTAGKPICQSAGTAAPLHQSAAVAEFIAAPIPRLIVTEPSPLSGMSVIMISQPYIIQGKVAGVVNLSIPHQQIQMADGLESTPGKIDLMTVTDTGTILTSRVGLADAPGRLPHDLATVLNSTNSAFIPSADGETYYYTFARVPHSPISVVGIWNPHIATAIDGQSVLPTWLFPILMWLASLTVAMLTLNTLVEQPINNLRERMVLFSNKRSIEPPTDVQSLPYELRDLNDHFAALEDSILKEEARLEDYAREKSILIKEIHHRVKNNLQMISSIMSMQIGEAHSEETVVALERLQDRVQSLATIHRDLYQSTDQSGISAVYLITDIAQKAAETVDKDSYTADITTDIDQIQLYPDQAVPLSLFLSEAMANAIKYGCDASAKRFSVKVSFKETDTECVLRISNTRCEQVMPTASSGLGRRLMTAFVIQLGATLDIEETDIFYTLTLRFEKSAFEPEARDF